MNQSVKPIRQVVFYAPRARNEWLAAHQEHGTPKGPYLNTEQPEDRSKPRLLLLVCPCGDKFVYERSE